LLPSLPSKRGRQAVARYVRPGVEWADGEAGRRIETPRRPTPAKRFSPRAVYPPCRPVGRRGPFLDRTADSPLFVRPLLGPPTDAGHDWLPDRRRPHNGVRDHD
jgi:hypothetical protein